MRFPIDVTAASAALPPGSPGPALFVFQAGVYAAGRLRVLSFRGRETMSRPFRFDVSIAVNEADHAELEAELLGQPASLGMLVPSGETQVVRGIVAAVEAQAAFQQGRYAFRVRLVPRFWLLGKRRTSRIFQNKTVPEIVATVLGAAGVARRWALRATYATRTYCVQYQETDLAFVARLLAEEGIFYWFERGAGDAKGAEETVVFCDTPRHYEPIAGDPQLVYQYEEGHDGLPSAEHHVHRFALRRGIQPARVLQRDYDFRRPRFDLRAEAKPAPAPKGESDAAEDALPFEVNDGQMYDHHGEDERPDVDGRTARVRLEQYRRRAWVAEGVSACRRLLPGFRFDLVDHGINRLNRSYVVARVDHEGRAPEVARDGAPVYTNSFACAPTEVALRPKRSRRALQQVVETALVVGPEGQEIYTDDLGRVKVQFPWDLDGQRNEHSSCWVRVAQAWAGPTFGFQFIPRVGMEVLVTFIGGDEDRPVVLGCLYNALITPSQLLPSKITRSGIRTRTTPGGGGFNELTFDDRAGEEQVLLRAQRRLDEVIGGDHSISVGGEERASTAGSRTEQVGGDVEVKIDGQRSEAVAGDHDEEIGGDFDRVVMGEQRTAVMGDASAEVNGNNTLSVRGNHHVIVGHGKGEGHSLLYVNGDYTVGVSQELKLSAKTAIKLSVGDSSVEITAEGIKLKGASISIEGADGARMKVKGNEIKMDQKLSLFSDTVELFSSKGSIVMDEDVHVDGKRVLLNCKPKAPDLAEEQAALPEEGLATFRVKRRGDGSVPDGVMLLIATPSGEVIEREADAEGKVEIKGKKGERFVLIGVRQGDHVFGHQNS